MSFWRKFNVWQRIRGQKERSVSTNALQADENNVTSQKLDPVKSAPLRPLESGVIFRFQPSNSKDDSVYYYRSKSTGSLPTEANVAMDKTGPRKDGRKNTTVTCTVADQQTASFPLEIIARGKEALEAYNRAIEQGITYDRRLPLMLIGHARNGKTSLKKSLIREAFNCEEDNTSGIEIDPSLCEINASVWNIDTGEVEAGGDEHSQTKYFERQAARIAAQNLKEESCVDGEDQSVAISKREGKMSNFGSTEALQEKIFLKVLKQLPNVDRRELYLSFWDFAGQTIFYATHPVFLSPRAIYLLVHNLTKDLHTKAVCEVKQGKIKCKEDIECSKTNLDNLHFWMSSVASVSQNGDTTVQSDVEKFSTKLPPVMLVCTHADKFSDSKGRAKEIAREIQSSIDGKAYEGHLVDDVFIVDNTLAGVSDDKEDQEIKRLRETIHEVAGELLKARNEKAFPLKWYQFEKTILSLRAKGHKHMTLKEARTIAGEKCDISDELQFKTLLNLLHDQKILVHFEDTEELDQLVFLDPQWLIDVFKEVITVKPREHQKRDFRSHWNALESKGILSKQLVFHVWQNLINPSIERSVLISIMEKFCLLLKWPSNHGNETYLVPSALMTCGNPDDLLPTSSVPPIFIRFVDGYVPMGFFQRLVVSFARRCIELFSKKHQPMLYRNMVRYYVEKNSIVLSERSCTVMAAVLGVNAEKDAQNEQNLDQLFYTVKEQLKFTVEEMRTEFLWMRGMKWEFCFRCSKCWKSSEKPCDQHQKAGCGQDECSHFLSVEEVDELLDEPLRCTRCPAGDSVVSRHPFSPWFGVMDSHQPRDDANSVVLETASGYPLRSSTLSNDQQIVKLQEVLSCWKISNETDIFPVLAKDFRLPSPINDNSQQNAIVLTSEMEQYVKTAAADEVAANLACYLQVDSKALEIPSPDVSTKVRCFARFVKEMSRQDVVERIKRKITGVAGPLVPEEMLVADLPRETLAKLSMSLSGGDEWKLFATHLGMDPDRIRFLDNRTLNPAGIVLECLASRTDMTVGQLYDAIVASGLESIADLHL